MGRGQKLVEDELLITLYEIHKSVWKVGDVVGLGGQTVYERLVRLGKINKMNVFSESDKDILKEKYGTYKNNGKLKDLAILMGRTKQFICRKAKELGLTDQKTLRIYARKDDSNPYWRFHDRVRILKGSPHKCEICGEDSPRKWYDWANLTGSYENPDDYKRMCRPCHKKYDNNRIVAGS